MCLRDLRREREPVAEVDRLRVVDFLRMNDDVSNRQAFADEVRKKAVEDVAVHDLRLEAARLRERAVRMELVAVVEHRKKAFVDLARQLEFAGKAIPLVHGTGSGGR